MRGLKPARVHRRIAWSKYAGRTGDTANTL
jgi:hypothetical protein